MTARNDITLIPLEADLDVTYAPMLRLALDQLLSAGCRRALVNMAKARYVDTAGMGVLVAASRRFRDGGGLLSIINASPQVVRALRVRRLLDFIPVRPADVPEPTALDPSARPAWQRTMRVDAEDLGAVRRRFAELVSGSGLTQDEEFDLTLACGEAMGNAVDHTSAGGVLVTTTAYPDRLVVQVADNGEGFDPREGTPCATDDRGRGICLMRMLADQVDICRKPHGHGTVVTLVKLLPPHCATGDQ